MLNSQFFGQEKFIKIDKIDKILIEYFHVLFYDH